MIQGYDQFGGVEALAEFARTGMKPPPLPDQEEMSILSSVVAPSPAHSWHREGSRYEEKSQDFSYSSQVSVRRDMNDFDHSVRSPYNNNTSMSWSATNSVGFLKFTPSRLKNEQKVQRPPR